MRKLIGIHQLVCNVPQNTVLKKSNSLYQCRHIPPAVISCAVRWYFRFRLGLRDMKALLFERGLVVTYETANAGVARAAFAARDASRNSSRASSRSDNISRSAGV